MRNKLLGTGLLVLCSVLGLTGCPGSSVSGQTHCTSNADCSSEQLCHPGAEVCVKACQSGNDCPNSAKNCAPLTFNNVATGSFCQCATDALCGGGTGKSAICSTTDKICETKCSDDSACSESGRKCDLPTGECVASSTSAVCSFQNPCTVSGQTCNLPVGACEVAANCSGEGETTCSYGQFCASSSCQAVTLKDPNESSVCANFDSSAGGKTPVWNPSSNSGPVIYSVKDVADVPTDCAGGTKAYTLEVKAYRTSGTWPANKADLSGFFYVRVNGSALDIPSNFLKQSNYLVDGNNLTATFTLCGDPADSSLSVGLFFTDGNETCFRAH